MTKIHLDTTALRHSKKEIEDARNEITDVIRQTDSMVLSILNHWQSPSANQFQVEYQHLRGESSRILLELSDAAKKLSVEIALWEAISEKL